MTWRDFYFWPLLYALGPAWMRRRIARYVSGNETMFVEEARALPPGLERWLPHANSAEALKELRMRVLADRSDPWVALWLPWAWIWRRVRLTTLPPPDRPCLILAAHRGNAWWSLPALRAQGRDACMIAIPPSNDVHTSMLLRFYRALRWRGMNRLGGAPVIPMRGGGEGVRHALRSGLRVIVLIDIPAQLSGKAEPVQFFGQTAWMPRKTIDIALEQQAEIWMLHGDVDPDGATQTLRFEQLDTSQGAQAVFQDYAHRLERAIRERPGSWHAWGHVELFFQPPDARSA